MAGLAESVLLKSPDGFTDIEGEILEISNGMLTVQTGVGSVRLPAAEVECFGAACPDGIARGVTRDEFTVVANSEIDLSAFRNVMLASSVSSPRDLSIESVDTTRAVVRNADGSHVGEFILAEPGSTRDGDIFLQTASLSQLAVPQAVGTSDETGQIIGIKAFAAVAHPGSGMTSVSMDDLRAITTGEVTNWSQLGGADVAIQVLTYPSDSQAHSNISALVGDTANLTATLQVEDFATAATMVNIFPGSLAIIDTQSIGQTSPMEIATSCYSSKPSSYEVNAGRYPLMLATTARYSDELAVDLAPTLISHSVSNSAQETLSGDGYFNQSIAAMSQEDKTELLTGMMTQDLSVVQRESARDMMQRVFDADKISVSYIANPQSLTAKSWNTTSHALLKAGILNGEFDGAEIMFMGFNGSGGSATASIDASRVAAEAAFEEFAKLVPEAVNRPEVTFVTSGHGNIAPAGCATVETIGAVEDRVEIWVRAKI